jgi:hypothetical protein
MSPQSSAGQVDILLHDSGFIQASPVWVRSKQIITSPFTRLFATYTTFKTGFTNLSLSLERGQKQLCPLVLRFLWPHDQQISVSMTIEHISPKTFNCKSATFKCLFEQQTYRRVKWKSSISATFSDYCSVKSGVEFCQVKLESIKMV